MGIIENTLDESDKRFAAYVAGLVSVLGHADRARPLRDYCTGLVMPGERKSVEPMAAVTGLRTASVAAAFCRERPLVGREACGQGARASDAGDGTDRGLDHR